MKGGTDAMDARVRHGNDDIQRRKQTLRRRISALRSAMTDEEWQKKSGIIRNRLLSCERWQQSRHIALYYSKDKEVDTKELIQQGWQEGKSIYLPKSYPQKKTMTFYRLTSFDQLAVAYYGLHEPIPGKSAPLSVEDLELVIVPGLVFDRSGYRIGYGGGFYDRFLATLPHNVYKVSLAFQFQVLQNEAVPRDVFDVAMDRIFTEKEDIVIV